MRDYQALGEAVKRGGRKRATAAPIDDGEVPARGAAVA
jgi:hypothetical protein